jgi:hypothetical protein
MLILFLINIFANYIMKIIFKLHIIHVTFLYNYIKIF